MTGDWTKPPSQGRCVPGAPATLRTSVRAAAPAAFTTPVIHACRRAPQEVILDQAFNQLLQSDFYRVCTALLPPNVADRHDEWIRDALVLQVRPVLQFRCRVRRFMQHVMSNAGRRVRGHRTQLRGAIQAAGWAYAEGGAHGWRAACLRA